MKKLAFIAPLIAVVTLLAACGGGAASPDKVAVAAGATSCDNSGFYIQSKLTNEKDVVYDCRFAQKLPKCVTYSGNVADDATDEVQVIFSNSLNSRRPACLEERAAAQRVVEQRRQAKAAARARVREIAHMRADSMAWSPSGSAWTEVTDSTSFTPYSYIAKSGQTYTFQEPNVWWKWVTGGQCSSAAQYESAGNSCFILDVVTRSGCPSSGVSVDLDEYQSQNGPQVNQDYGSSGPLSPQEVAKIEVDVSASVHVPWAKVGSINCY
ncbi:MAG: hypothetical protein ACRDQZ_19005 [Mycobacteriales bacterium]